MYLSAISARIGLLNRCIGVKRFILEPDVITTAAAQQEMAADLRRHHVHWLLLAPPVPGDAAFVAHRLPGSGLLDTFIAQHYRVAALFGSYSVMLATEFPESPPIAYP